MPADNRAFAEKLGFPYRLLSDPGRVASEAYGTARPEGHERYGVPRRFSYLVDPEGLVRKSYVVRDVAAHPAEVLGDLRAFRDERD